MTDNRLQAAREAGLRGQHQQAVDLCVAVLQETPGEPMAVAFLGLSLWRASAFAQAVEVLQRALKHFPAQEELSLALLDACLAIGKGEQALQFAATLPEALLSRPPFRSRIEERLVKLLNAGQFTQVDRELRPLMQAQSHWPFGQTLAASVMFHASGRGVPADVLQGDGSAAEVGEAWREQLGAAMSNYRGRVLHQIRALLGATPADDHLLELQARARFEEGLPLDAAELLHMQQRLGCGLQGPFPLKHAMEPGGVKTVQLLESARLFTIPEPRRVGAALSLDGSTGRALTSARYVADVRNATVVAGSDVVLLDAGQAWCDLLTHPLGELAGHAADTWIALGSTRQLMLRDLPATRLQGTAISLLGGATRFYGHWLLDYLPRLRAIEHHPEAGSAAVLVDDGMPASHYQALQLLLGEQVPMRRIAQGHGVRVDRLLFSGPDVFFPHASRYDAPLLASVAPSSPEGMAYLRARMLSALPGAAAPRGGRLIVRRRSATRRVLNEDVLSDLLIRDWGFEELHPETLSFADQVRRFHAAEVIVGAQGSAMSNCVFCAPGTVVLSLCSNFAANFPSWADALEQLGVRHCFVVGEALEGSHPLPLQRDVHIDSDSLHAALDALGVTRIGKSP